ncbi:MAG TPA: esterase [Candidatus Marinimicrobia bacterium]|jgi:polyhydroxybutyrate depolymerase|nr:esterase [Candidatus Neomarinimicrobiota bacterium]
MKHFLLISLTIVLFVSRKNTTEENLIAFDMNGETRQYILHRPDGLQENSPLVFVLHGLGGSASGIREYSRMDKVADENGFAVCYPQGTGGSEDTKYTKKGTHFWNVGYEVHKNETVDDVEFITSLAMFLQEKYNLDSEKTFCTGMSNGGDMSYLLGCAAPDIFKAIAPITGCMMKWIYDSCNENDPVPVFHVHGTADHTTYYDGDEENRDEWGAYMGVERTINLWIERNECSNTSVDTLPDIDKNDGSIVIAQKNTGGKNNNEVWFYKVIGGDHEWPQGWPKNSGNQDLNTSAEIWNFFQHSMKN